MKNGLFLKIFFGICAIALAGDVFAQACTANLTASAPGTVSGNNCGNNTALQNICGNGIGLNLAGVDIYSVALGASQNFTFSVTTAAFTPQIAITGSPCSSNTTCIDNQTIAASGTVTSGTISGQPAGTYFIFVGDSAADSPGCGAYNMTITGTLPVKLQKFSVK